jgi:hypothetical protein
MEPKVETEAITVQQPAALAAIRPTTPRAIVMAEALKEDLEQRAILAEYVEQLMTEGVDYGAIPGTPQEIEISVGGRKKKMRKNNLLKPGAEKIFDLFRCRPEYEFISRDVDREAGLYSYEIRCKAVSRETDTILNEGLGSASSFESKHRYRNTERVCPNCQKPNIRKSRPPREGWYCWEKTGGCGANFEPGDPAIMDQEVGKTINPDMADVANTVLKMAKKRAQVDCAIALARCSDLFSQDLDDGPADEPEARRPQTTRGAPPKSSAAESSPPSGVGVALWARAQERYGKGPGGARDRFGEAARKVFGSTPKPTAAWTVEEAKKVEAILFASPDDVPFETAEEELNRRAAEEYREPGRSGEEG